MKFEVAFLLSANLILREFQDFVNRENLNPYCHYLRLRVSVQLVRAAVYQPDKREDPAVLQPPHVYSRTGGIPQGGDQVGLYRLRPGLGTYHRTYREGPSRNFIYLLIFTEFYTFLTQTGIYRILIEFHVLDDFP